MKRTRPGLRTAWLAAVFYAASGVVCLGQGPAWEQVVASGDQALAAADYEAAEQHYRSALEQARSFAAADRRKPEILIRLARLYRAEGDFAKPEEIYKQALLAAEGAFEPGAPELARYWNEVGRYYHARRKYEQAGEFYRQAFAARVKNFGQEHAEVADSINNLAVLYENQALFDKAEIYYQYALKIRENAVGPEDLHTIETLEHYARLLQKLNRPADAAPMVERSQRFRTARVEALAGRNSPPPEPSPETATAVQPPELEERTEPRYTEEARIARHEGVVVLSVDISPEGRAVGFRLLRSLGLGLDEQAMAAVQRWRFKPARSGRQAVPFRANLEITFRVL